MTPHPVITAWHQFVTHRDMAALKQQLADEGSRGSTARQHMRLLEASVAKLPSAAQKKRWEELTKEQHEWFVELGQMVRRGGGAGVVSCVIAAFRESPALAGWSSRHIVSPL